MGGYWEFSKSRVIAFYRFKWKELVGKTNFLLYVYILIYDFV